MNVPKLRFKEFTDEWQHDKICNVTTYVDYRGKTPNKTETGIFLVTAKNVKKGYIDYDCSKKYYLSKHSLYILLLFVLMQYFLCQFVQRFHKGLQ